VAWLSIEKSVFTKRTQLKNAHVFRHETVMKRQSWVRYAKKDLKMGGKAPKYRSGRVVLCTNEAKLRHGAGAKRRDTYTTGIAPYKKATAAER
jgi:hypothetical protein